MAVCGCSIMPWQRVASMESRIKDWKKEKRGDTGLAKREEELLLAAWVFWEKKRNRMLLIPRGIDKVRKI